MTEYSGEDLIENYRRIFERFGIDHLYPVRWLPGFLALPAYIRVASLGNGVGPINQGVFPMDGDNIADFLL